MEYLKKLTENTFKRGDKRSYSDVIDNVILTGKFYNMIKKVVFLSILLEIIIFVTILVIRYALWL